MGSHQSIECHNVKVGGDRIFNKRSLNPVDVQMQTLQSHGFNKINVDLNKGSGEKSTYHLPSEESVSAPITRVQVTFNRRMEDGLIKAGYTKITEDPSGEAKGDSINIWVFAGCTKYDTPIVDFDATTDAESGAQMFCDGWERVGCNLGRGAGGNWVYVWVKREEQTYICDVSATDSYGSDIDYLKEGYIRMDEDANWCAGGSDVFIWYRQTTDSKRALTDLQISTNDREYQALQQQHYQSVSVNLNEKTGGNQVYLWYKKQGGNNPIKAITLLHNPAAFEEYEKAGVTVIKRDLNTGNKGWIEYLCVNQ